MNGSGTVPVKTFEDLGEFIATTLVSLAPSVRGQLSDEIVELCHVVAQSSGGFLGIGKVSWSRRER